MANRYNKLHRPALLLLKLLYVVLTLSAILLLASYLSSIPANREPSTTSISTEGRVAGAQTGEEQQDQSMLDQVVAEGGELFVVSAGFSLGLVVLTVATPVVRNQLFKRGMTAT